MADKRIWELLVKQFNQDISEEEIRELHLLLIEKQDTISYGELLTDLRSLPLRPDAADRAARDTSLSAIRQAIREKDQVEGPEGKKGRMVLVAGVAAIFILVLTGWLVWRPGRHGGTDAVPFDRILTKVGSKTLIKLPDSSTVVLNSACQFSYNKDFGVKKREMQLAGEAYFDIHSNPEMPLVIHAGNAIIRVLGTAFNVRANPADSFVEATLVRGIIEVSLRSDPERTILLRPNEKILIRNTSEAPAAIAGAGRAGSKGEMIKVSRVEVDPMDTSYTEGAWLKDKMVFRKEPFATLAKRMERWYNVRIILADSSLNGLQFTGSFEKETVDEAFRALRNSAPFNYIIEGKTITVTRRRGR